MNLVFNNKIQLKIVKIVLNFALFLSFRILLTIAKRKKKGEELHFVTAVQLSLNRNYLAYTSKVSKQKKITIDGTKNVL